ncbi:MAG: UDP-glucose--hexose-1-phosphate uridylyltransferase [Atopobiaceae bacterium]|nr:UDP-glucose--hexose-1-phosphate uridylyltransferase [Olsenella sp.]MBR3328858.1 UDP-glucose--hexose-1-phosphate uridylyltransferase [Atopobiaceae bacterium]MBR3385580.1 UDP-glucose--hexose-1-phosphate uridylyltransferase [Atopobiaceae bacterium]
MDVSRDASTLVAYGVSREIIDPLDEDWAYNRVLEAVGALGPEPLRDGDGRIRADEGVDVTEGEADFPLMGLLGRLADAAVANGVAADTAQGRDIAAMRVAGALMARPSEIAHRFGVVEWESGVTAATDWFYKLCCDVGYVRREAIARNVGWTTPTRWGELEITINKSKPEKDPRDIAAAGAAKAGGEVYPACQLCMENEGYPGRMASSGLGEHPARQNLRIIPIELGGERWGLQYSPYAYFEEHCIAMSREHRLMHVDQGNMGRLLDFVDRFPHYFVGSNADIPIVGGSILSHDHFQGGRHVFPLMRATASEAFAMDAYPNVGCEVLEWPLTVLRLTAPEASRAELLDAAGHVFASWDVWGDESVGVVCEEFDEAGVRTRHNTVTPVARKLADGRYELLLALRCNITSEEHPLGVFHPHEDKWHVKKENIGLIEVMGLAILPPRLEAELDAGTLTRDQIGQVFAGVLEDAGVYKWDEAGRAALGRFLDSL